MLNASKTNQGPENGDLMCQEERAYVNREGMLRHATHDLVLTEPQHTEPQRTEPTWNLLNLNLLSLDLLNLDLLNLNLLKRPGTY